MTNGEAFLRVQQKHGGKQIHLLTWQEHIYLSRRTRRVKDRLAWPSVHGGVGGGGAGKEVGWNREKKSQFYGDVKSANCAFLLPSSLAVTIIYASGGALI